MPNFSTSKNNFTSGELDPRLNARDDVAQYNNGLETCENFQVMPFGGLRKRNGTEYVAEVKDSTKKVRLIRFEFSVEQAYILEFGDLYLRFYKEHGQIYDGVSPYEIATTYLEDDLYQLKFTQSADVLFIAHPDYAPRKVSRTGDISWSITVIGFVNGPFLDDNVTSTTIKSSGVVGNVTLTASSSIFESGHIGSIWKLTRGKLASLVESTLNSLNDTSASISLAGSTVVFRSTGTWVGSITIQRSFDNGTNWFDYETYSSNVTREFQDSRDVLFRARMTSYTSGAATIRLSQVSIDGEGFGTVRITAYTSDLIVSATVIEELSEETIGDSENHITNGDFISDISDWSDESTGSASIAWNAGQWMDLIGAAASVAWTQQQITGIPDTSISHILSFDIGGGAVDLRIGTTSTGNEILSDTNYAVGSHSYSFKPGTGTIYVQFKHAVNATHTIDNITMDSVVADSDETDYWAEGSWSDVRGWPRTIGLYEQRLFFCSTSNEPTNVWGSVSGDFENFKAGVDDDSAVTYTLNSQGVNVARWMVPWKILAIGSAASEFRVSGTDSGSALTPTNVNAKAESNEGSMDLQAIQIAKSILFIDRTEKNIREFAFSYNEDSYDAPLLNQLAQHLTNTDKIVDFAYQKDPDSIVWFVLASGEMIGLTYNPKQQIVAFYQFTTDGEIESVAVIPNDDGNDEVWISVKRTIDGADVRYVEYLKEVESEELEDAFFVDSGVTYSGAPANIITGLDHLEGKTVDVLGAGSIMTQQVVESGQITIDAAVTPIQIGLPYTATARLMPFTQGSEDGSGQGRLKSVYELVFNLYNSVTMKFGPDDTEEKLKEVFFTKLLGQSLLFTGLRTETFQGDVDATQQVTVVSDKPTPLNILAITARGHTSQS